MRLTLAGGALAAFAICGLVSGCAFVPDLEPETSFSYAEIMTQLECELYLASERVKSETDANPDTRRPFEPTDWIANITINPDLSNDASVNLAGSGVNSLAKAYTKWTSGGGVAPNTGVEINGDANANDQYVFKLLNLYLTPDFVISNKNKFDPEVFPIAEQSHGKTVAIEYKNPDSLRISKYQVVEEKVEDTAVYVVSDVTSPLYKHRLINPRLRNQCQFSEAAERSLGFKNHISISTGDYPSEIGGVFGLYEFMTRSLAATDAGITEVTQFAIEKWYKMNISAGVTPGWYVPFGNSGLSAGAVQKLFDRVNVTLKKATPPPQPAVEYVCIVADLKNPVCSGKQTVATKGTGEPKRLAAPAGAEKNFRVAPFAATLHPVSPGDKDLLQMNSVLQSIQSKVSGQ
ncbi:hypothetical protein [Methylocapsa sp. S129]|uniref:hypothetical protein n=1 Tax=Methylocapsa sp. S129 TaxID=1641869 RepID=UPI00131B64B0|nr:hypothetical protein [Methylocapsa sp. S129]